MVAACDCGQGGLGGLLLEGPPPPSQHCSYSVCGVCVCVCVCVCMCVVCVCVVCVCVWKGRGVQYTDVKQYRK